MNTVTVKLQYPVTHAGIEYTELTMRRCKVVDRRIAMKAGGTAADQEVRLFANLCGIPEEAMNELDEVDYGRLQEAFVGFRGTGSVMPT